MVLGSGCLMRKSLGWRFLLIFCLVVGLFCAGCGESEPTPEEKAQAIYERAKKLESEGKELEALKEYDSLVDYSSLAIYQQARKELAAKGYSIGAAMYSWTIKRMFEAKNEFIGKPSPGAEGQNVIVRLHQKDAWGNFLWIEYGTDPRFAFTVNSAGPDGQEKTGDDLLDFVRKEGLSHEDLAEMTQPGEEAVPDAKPETQAAQEPTEGQPAPEAPKPAPEPKPLPTAKELMPSPPSEPEKPPETAPSPSPATPSPATPSPIKPGRGGEATVDLDELLQSK